MCRMELDYNCEKTMKKETVKLLCRTLRVSSTKESQMNEIQSLTESFRMVILTIETTSQTAAKIRSGNCHGLQISSARIAIEKYEKEIPSVLYFDTLISIDELGDSYKIIFE